jgi:hypothetical protein
MAAHRYTGTKQSRPRFVAAVGDSKIETDSFEDAANWFKQAIGHAIKNHDNPDVAFVCNHGPYRNFHQFPWGSQSSHEWRKAIVDEAWAAGIA